MHAARGVPLRSVPVDTPFLGEVSTPAEVPYVHLLAICSQHYKAPEVRLMARLQAARDVLAEPIDTDGLEELGGVWVDAAVGEGWAGRYLFPRLELDKVFGEAGMQNDQRSGPPVILRAAILPDYCINVHPRILKTAVRFKVYLLRRRGRRIPWRDVVNGPCHVGDVITHAVDIGSERYAVATLRPLDPAAAAPIPDLYEPVLIGFFTLAFRLRGFERVESTAGHFSVVQEWHCELP